jgi:hypothetical protein
VRPRPQAQQQQQGPLPSACAAAHRPHRSANQRTFLILFLTELLLPGACGPLHHAVHWPLLCTAVCTGCLLALCLLTTLSFILCDSVIDIGAPSKDILGGGTGG